MDRGGGGSVTSPQGLVGSSCDGGVFRVLDLSTASCVLDLSAQLPSWAAADEILGRGSLRVGKKPTLEQHPPSMPGVRLAERRENAKHRVPQRHRDEQFLRDPDVVRNNMLKCFII